MSLKKTSLNEVASIKELVDKMISAAPKHKKTGTTVINKDGKVYTFNYKKK